MFTLLILASYVAGEWVEISQNHYRKEPPRRVTINNEDTSVGNRIYTNYTLTERPWNQGVVARIANRGNIKRVQFPSKAKDKFSNERLPERISSERTNTNREYENFGPVRTPNVKSDDNKNIKRKFDVDNKLKDESAEINEKLNVRFQAPSQQFHIPTPNTEGQLEDDNYKTQEFKILNVDYHGKLLQNNKFKFEENPSLKSAQSTDDSKNKRVQMIKHSDEDFTFNINNKKIKETPNEEPKTRTSTRNESSLPNGELPSQNRVKNVKNKHRNISKSDSDINVNEINKSYFHKESDKEIKIGNSTEIIKELNSQRKNDDGKGPNDTKRDTFHQTDDNIGKTTKSNTVEVIWKLMKVVTDNISRNTRRSFRSKVRYLEDLRNTILSNIEERIEGLWPDAAAGARRRRSAARGHVEFPSSESALMTISFLTFAVFLIKLVLQVIHTYKNKTMMVTPALVAAVGRAAVTLTNRSPDN